MNSKGGVNIETLNAVWEFIKKIFAMFRQEIIAFLTIIGFSIFNQQTASLVTIYGSAFLILLAIIRAVFGIETPLIKNLNAKVEKYDKFANDDGYLENMSKNMKGIGDTMKEIVKKLFQLLGKTLKLGWLNKVTTATNIVLITVYYEYVSELFTKYTPWTKQFNIWLIAYTVLLAVGILGASGPGAETIQKALARINQKVFKKAFDRLSTFDINDFEETLKLIPKFKAEIKLAEVENTIESIRILLDKIKPVIKEENFNYFKKVIDNVELNIKKLKAKRYIADKAVNEALAAEVLTPVSVTPSVLVEKPKESEDRYVIKY